MWDDLTVFLDPAEEQPEQPELDEKQLIRLLQPEIQRVREVTQDQHYDNERRQRINRAKLYRLYAQGHHHVAPQWMGDGYGNQIADWSPIDADGDQETFMFPVNLVGSDGRKYVSIQSQSVPGVKAVANDTEEQTNVDAARLADAALRDWWRKINVRELIRQVAGNQFHTSTAFICTEFIVDPHKYGTSVEEVVIDFAEDIMPDGSVVRRPVTERREYPNGDVEAMVYTEIEVATPIGAKDLRECDWIRLERMMPKQRILALFRKELQEYREFGLEENTLPSTQDAVRAAEAIVSVDGRSLNVMRASHLPFAEEWWRPSQYELVKNQQTRQVFQEQFPEGVKITSVGKVVVRIEPRPIEENWVTCRSGMGPYLSDPPLCHDIIPLNRAIDNFVSIAIETILRGIPKTIVDQQLLDLDALRDQPNTVGELIPTKVGIGGNISQMFGTLPTARFSEQMVPFGTLLRELSQDIGGVRPELYGAGPTSQTFREALQRRNQALMQFVPAGDEIKQMLVGMSENAIRLRAKYGTSDVKVQRKGGVPQTSERFNLMELSPDGWHIEAEDGIPMSSADRSDTIKMYLKEFPPQVIDALNLLDPANNSELKELLGVPGFKTPIADIHKKVMRRIARLLQEKPVTQPDGMGGMAEKPSIMPEPFVDQYDLEAEFIKRWLNDVGQDIREENPDGYRNVQLHGIELFLADTKMKAGAAGPPEGGPPAPGGAPGQSAEELPPPGAEQMEQPPMAPPPPGQMPQQNLIQ